MPTKRGRKPLAPAQSIEPNTNHAVLLADAQSASDFNRLQNDYNLERDELNQMIGRIQMGFAIGNFTTMMNLQSLKSIKESKSYKSLAGQSGTDRKGFPIADMGTWDGFCRAIGFSREKVDQDLLNLDAFGQEALESLSSIGAGYRELRQYRKLPEDRKQALVEIAKAGDKDGFIELAEEIISKHAKEKEDLTAQVQEAKETIETKDRVLKSNSERIMLLEEQTSRKFKPRPKSKARTAHEEAILDELSKASASALMAMQRVFLAVDAALTDDGGNEAISSRGRQEIEFLVQQLAGIADEFGIAVDLESRLKPSWVDEDALAIIEARNSPSPHTSSRSGGASKRM